MPKIQFKYQDEYDNISMEYIIVDDMTTIEWYIEKFCDFLNALKFHQGSIQKFIPYDGEIYTIEDWVESLKEE